MAQHRATSDDDDSQVLRSYVDIKRRIVEGRYRPGAHLSEAAVARLQGTSRTPVREALSRLIKEGYVQHRARYGYFVTPISLAVLRDTYEFRRLTEGWAAARAAAVATPAEIAQMRAAATHNYKPGAEGAYQRAIEDNLTFHLAVASGSHNGLLVEHVRDSLTQTNRILSLGMEYQPFHERATAEHLRIVDAIEQHRETLARRRMEAHLDRTLRLMMDNLARPAASRDVMAF